MIVQTTEAVMTYAHDLARRWGVPVPTEDEARTLLPVATAQPGLYVDDERWDERQKVRAEVKRSFAAAARHRRRRAARCVPSAYLHGACLHA